MQVINIHSRKYPVGCHVIWEQICQISSRTDPLWPFEEWPRMVLYPGLTLGAKGGHGPIRYTVEDIQEMKEIQFRFLRPAGFFGFHVFRLKGNDFSSELVHEIQMHTNLYGSFLWFVAIKHFHDALIEDAFTKLERSLKLPIFKVKWTLWVKILRLILK